VILLRKGVDAKHRNKLLFSSCDLRYCVIYFLNYKKTNAI